MIQYKEWRGKVDLVPAEGIEPPTFGLQNRCTTAVLRRPGLRLSAASRRADAARHPAAPPLARRASSSRTPAPSSSRPGTGDARPRAVPAGARLGLSLRTRSGPPCPFSNGRDGTSKGRPRDMRAPLSARYARGAKQGDRIGLRTIRAGGREGRVRRSKATGRRNRAVGAAVRPPVRPAGSSRGSRVRGWARGGRRHVRAVRKPTIRRFKGIS